MTSIKKNDTPQEPIKKQLWKANDKLRKNIEVAEYKHIILGHVFEYFPGEFALAEGKRGDSFITPEALWNCWWKC